MKLASEPGPQRGSHDYDGRSLEVAGHSPGTLTDSTGNPIVIEDLWAIVTGNNSTGSDPNAVYFTAGLMDETHGLFGDLAVVPETQLSRPSRDRLGKSDMVRETQTQIVIRSVTGGGATPAPSRRNW